MFEHSTVINNEKVPSSSPFACGGSDDWPKCDFYCQLKQVGQVLLLTFHDSVKFSGDRIADAEG